MTSTSDFIANKFGVSMAQARDFIMSHVSDPASIYGMATQFHVTSDMLAEITGYSSAEVEGFFTERGMDGMALREVPTSTPGPTATHLVEIDGVSLPDAMIKLNTYGGAVSTQALHAAIVAQTGQAAYDAAFSAAPYDTDHDGLLSPSELGTSSLGSVPATSATVESILFGTLVGGLKSLDQMEFVDLAAFTQDHAAQIQAGDAATVGQLLSLMLTAMTTPTDQPVLSDDAIAEAIVGPAAEIISMVGTTAGSDSVFSVFLAV